MSVLLCASVSCMSFSRSSTKGGGKRDGASLRPSSPAHRGVAVLVLVVLVVVLDGDVPLLMDTSIGDGKPGV